MDKFKNFLRGKKIDKHFKQSGKGARLSETSSTSTPSVVSGSSQGANFDRVAASDVAAQAALKRLLKDEPRVSSSQKKIQMQAMRELEEERRQQDPEYAMRQLGIEPVRQTDMKEFEHSNAISGVFYTCELLGDDQAMTKAELMDAIEQFLMNMYDDEVDDKMIPAILLLYSLNTNSVKEAAIETMGKYLKNLVDNPSEPKFRRIRTANKVFQERVSAAKGAVEFLLAVGFEKQMLPLKEGDPEELFLVIPEKIAVDSGRLTMALEALQNGQRIVIKVARSPSIYRLKENERVTAPVVPAAFYDLTAEEVKKEQQLKTEEVNRMLSLRTREMRERDEKLRQYKYKYTLIRIRVPGHYFLQGTFGSYETLFAVREFVASFLSDSLNGVSWDIKDSMNSNRKFDESSTLAELELAPAAVLHLEFPDNVSDDVLAEEHREKAIPFSK